MPRKQSKTETKTRNSTQGVEEETFADLEQELEPEELESLEEEYEEDDDLVEEDELDEEEDYEEMAAAEPSEDEQQAEEPAALEAGDGGNRPQRVSAKAEAELEDEELEAFDEFDEFDEEDEDVVREPPRRETRQEMLGRLMLQLLEDRERVHQALERVRDLKTQLDDAGSRPPEKLKEQYHNAVVDLSQARRQENFARSELMQVLSWRG